MPDRSAELSVGVAGGIRPSLPVESTVRVAPEEVNWALPTLTMMVAFEDKMTVEPGRLGVLEGGEIAPSSPVEKKVEVPPETLITMEPSMVET